MVEAERVFYEGHGLRRRTEIWILGRRLAMNEKKRDRAGLTSSCSWTVQVEGARADDHSVMVEVYDADERLVGQGKGAKGEILIDDAQLWWPRGLNLTVGYLYTFKVPRRRSSLIRSHNKMN